VVARLKVFRTGLKRQNGIRVWRLLFALVVHFCGGSEAVFSFYPKTIQWTLRAPEYRWGMSCFYSKVSGYGAGRVLPETGLPMKSGCQRGRRSNTI
jgi:hypothetical protein